MIPPALSPQTGKHAAFRARLFKQFEPPVAIDLAEWADKEIHLPATKSARVGRYKTWPYMREIFDCIGSGRYEYVTLQKGTRLGFTAGIGIAIGAMAAINPCAMGLVVPNESHARDFLHDEIVPIFDATPSLRGLFVEGRLEGRNTAMRKRFKTGASLKILSARSVASLRRHDFKALFIDEADACEVTVEGDPLAIVEKRTFAHGDRIIVRGSTPTDEETSVIERAYNESDMRIFEILCPYCRQWFELLWEHIQWDQGEPQTAKAYCPHCGKGIDESSKPELVEHGRWRPTQPQIARHAGFRLNALVSLLENAAWPKLAAEFLSAKRAGPVKMKPFVNTVLAKTWKTSIGNISAENLASRVEPIGLDSIPDEIVLLTVGADVQNDRIEATVLGWPVTGAPAALGHVRIDGNTQQDEVWRNFDEFLRTRYRHPRGWEMRIDAAAIDSGGSEGRTQRVYDFCGPRLHRRIYAIAARAGARPLWKASARIKTGKMARLFIVGHDAAKSAVLNLIAQEPFIGGERNPHSLRVSDELDDEWFEQATSEVQRQRFIGNRSIMKFEPKRRGARTEALDCLVYGYAVRHAPAVMAIDIRSRAARKPIDQSAPAKPPPQSGARQGGFANWAQRFNNG